MRAAQYIRPGRIECREIPDTVPGPGEVTIAVEYCGICGTDVHIFKGHMDQRVHPPQAVGHEMSGKILRLGDGVTEFRIGDAVTVRPLDNCGSCNTCRAGFTHICEKLKFFGIETPGAFAEEWVVPARQLHRLPDNMPMDLAALVEPAAVACHDVRRSGLKEGDFVVVNGGGPIGMLIALTARKAGGQVTVIEINPARLRLARELGFAVIDPKTADAVARIRRETGGSGADVVFEVTGSEAGARLITEAARPRGTIVMVAIYPAPVPVDLHKFFWKELTMTGARVYEREDFERAIALVAARELPFDRLISRVFPLEELQNAFEYLGQAPDAMKILIRCRKEA